MTVLAFDLLVEGKPLAVEVDGKKLCIAKVGEEVFAVDNICTHSDAELSDGETNGYKIECWLHGAEFDLRTGAVLTAPATIPLKTYKVTREGNSVTISHNSNQE
jgi:3-phenylpropionate/trans-cinnamate dioxygenase ferredoxin subunit